MAEMNQKQRELVDRVKAQLREEVSAEHADSYDDKISKDMENLEVNILKNQQTAIEKAVNEAVAKAKPAFYQYSDVTSGKPWNKADPLKDKAFSEMDVNELSLMTGRCIRYLMAGQGFAHQAIDMAHKDGEVNVCKALGQSTLAGGGALVPPEFSASIIEFLRPMTVVRASGVPTIGLRGTMHMPFGATGATGTYIGESVNRLKTEPTFGQLEFREHILAAVVPMSNSLLRNGGAAADSYIRDDLAKGLAQKEDLTFLRSLGVSNEPKGYRGWVDAANTFSADTTVNIENVNNDSSKAIRLMREQNIMMSGRTTVWHWAPRTTEYLRTKFSSTQDTTPFRAEIEGGTYHGFRWSDTTLIPTNLGAGTDSEIYLVNTSDMVIADALSLQVEVFPNGTYYDGAALQSGISRDETVIRGQSIHDFGARQRGKEIVLVDTVRWGA